MDPIKGLSDFEAARADPSSVFDAPDEIVSAPHLTNAEKLALLRSWKLDEERLQSSEGENMGGGEDNRLSEVQEAINRVKKTSGKNEANPADPDKRQNPGSQTNGQDRARNQ